MSLLQLGSEGWSSGLWVQRRIGMHPDPEAAHDLRLWSICGVGVGGVGRFLSCPDPDPPRGITEGENNPATSQEA